MPLNKSDYSNIEFPEFSDVIIIKKASQPLYYNVQTKKNGIHLHDVVRDKKFIVINEKPYYYPRISMDILKLGFCLCECRYGIIAIKAYMDKQTYEWVELERFLLNRKSIGKLQYDEYVDMCGQTAVIGDKIYGVQIYGARKVLAKHFGKVITKIRNDKEKADIFTFSDMADVLSVMRYVYIGCDNNHLEYDKVMIIYENSVIFSEKDSMPPLPEAAYDKMKKVAYLNIKSNFAERCGMAEGFDLQFNDSELRLSCLQKSGDTLWERFFTVDVDFDYPYEKSRFYFMEYMRMPVCAECCRKENDIMCSFHSPVWTDGDYSGTGFYMTKLMDYWFDMLNEAIEKEDLWLQTLKIRYKSKRGIFPRDIMLISSIIKNSKVLEMIMNLGVKDDFKKVLCYDICSNSAITDKRFVRKTLGAVDETQKQFHKMIGLPKGMFEYAVNNDMGDVIIPMKDYFSISEESKQYFMRMNSNDYRYMAGEIEYFMNHISLSYFSSIFNSLGKIFGYKNWSGYLNFLKKVNKNDEIRTYHGYIQRLIALGDLAQSAEWKLMGEDLKKSYDSLEITYFMVNNKEKYEELCSIYKDKAKEWAEYLYSDYHFSVLYPKDPIELIEEGIRLNHCSKEFMVPVAEGKTMILFLRERGSENKPYYTIEIKNGKIRQCHGFNNCNITNKVEKFLIKYCDIMHIEFSSGACRLGVD